SDISTVGTFGFRGEALASISNVSSIKIFSKRKEDTGGFIFKEGDKVIEHRRFDCPEGTNIEVRRLFFNAPVRKRFMRSAKFLKTEIIRMFQDYVFAEPEVSFSLEINGENYFEGLAVGQTAEIRAEKIFGFANPVAAEYESPTTKIKCLLYPADMKSSRRWQFVFVNRRPVSERFILKAIENALSGFFPSGKFPPAFVYIETMPQLIDVNVHPTKREIRFQSPRNFYSAVYETVRKKFTRSVTTEYVPEEKKEDIFDIPPAGEKIRSQDNSSAPPLEPQRKMSFGGEKPDWDSFYFVGISHRKFIIFSSPAAIIIMDFHAACERINYERLKTLASSSKAESQRLLVPADLKLPREDAEILWENRDFLFKLGIEFSKTGGAIRISALPAAFRGSDREFLEKIAAELANEKKRPDLFAAVRDEILKILACHISPRAGDNLKREDAEAILRELKRCEEPLRCPHGRPIMVVLPLSKIDSMLLR
ncbi:MAG: hypothetical protein J7L54_05385, partial [Elusimicrobia bacterium]|nr:hypothetical protein [Elusimicrobiota bacterium]